MRFCIVGTVGFLADAGITVILATVVNLEPLPARMIAFIFAAVITWYLNKTYTFRENSGISTLISYIFLTSASAALNISVYSIWIKFSGNHPIQLLIGIGIGSAVALVFNYTISKRIIFRKIIDTKY